MKRIIDIIFVSCIFLSILFSVYSCFGRPYNLHAAANRIFDDHMQSYKLRDGALTIRAEDIGWDGTEWTKKEAIQDGHRQIEKLYRTVQSYNPKIKRIEVKIYYLGRQVLQRVINISD